MQSPSSFTGILRQARDVAQSHKTLVILLATLAVIAFPGRLLRGALTGGSPSPQFLNAGTGDDDHLRACSGMHTIFNDYETIAEVQNVYVERMSAVFTEHEKILRTPSAWKCGLGTSVEPNTPVIQALANELPGWHMIPSSGSPPVQRPVTFDAFSAIVSELQREYECKLVELQDRALLAISRNKDRAPGSFCCANEGCVPAGPSCVGPVTSDSMCDQQCPIYFSTSDIAIRTPLYDTAIQDERQRSRNALERALLTYRSADMHYIIARQLVCYERASLDLRNELNLIAGAISCTPKIWDALTSIHDKKR